MKRALAALLVAALWIVVARVEPTRLAAQPKPTTYPTTYPTTAPGYATIGPTIIPGTIPPGTTTPKPTAPPTATPKPPTPAPTSPPGGALVWQAGVHPYSVRSGSGQCGSPTVNGATYLFSLAISGTNCYRNQVMPAAAGATSYLNSGSTYQWTFTYRDSPAPGMGPDKDARSLIWQIHPTTCACTPCTTLNFINGPTGVSSPQYWGVYNCGHGAGNVIAWSGPYTPGAVVVWKILVRISNPQGAANGMETVWKDGTQVYSANNIVTMCCATVTSPAPQWWNFGPYKWRWELAGGGGSSLTKVSMTIDSMTLVKTAGAKKGNNHGH
jgi:hypothetical protein